ncbi:MAG: oligosaccharide flippase family protein, partial [Bacteroidia bacterium]|nr:oligosaccharide flippase family protein [Bacteroidia bacterium]
MLKKLFGHSFIYGLAPQVSKVAGLFALPIITQDLTEFDFGMWGLIIAYVGGLDALASMGLNVVLSNSFVKMKHQYKWVWRQIYGFLLLWAIPYSFLLGLVLWFVLPDSVVEYRWTIVLLVALPKILFGPTSTLGRYMYQLDLKPSPVAIRMAISGLLTVALNVFTISYLKMGFMGWLWSMFIVALLINLSYLFPVNLVHKITPIFNFKWRTIRQAIKVGVPTIPHTYASYLLNTSDRIVMDQMNVTIGNLGIYSLSARFGSYFSALSTAINRAISPMMLKNYANDEEWKARDMIFAFQIIMLVSTFLYSIWSKEIFQLLIKNEALNKTFFLSIILVMAYNYRPMYVGAMNKLFYEEKTNLLWRVSFIAGVSNVVLNIIFIPIFGFTAAAYTTFACL